MKPLARQIIVQAVVLVAASALAAFIVAQAPGLRRYIRNNLDPT